MEPDVTAAFKQAAQALHDSARSHKQAEAAHRRRARALQRDLDLLRRVCLSHGIEFELVTDTAPKEAQS